VEKYWVCVFVALGIRYAVRMYHVVICGLLRSTEFSHLTSQKAPFSKTLLNTKCVFSKNLSEILVIPRRIKRAITTDYIGIHVK